MKDKVYTQEELSVIGLEIIEARRKGGKTTFKNHGGNKYFVELQKKSVESRKANKLLRRTII